jgi:hypothetical protein
MIESRCPELRPRKEGEILGPSYKMPDTRAYIPKPREFMISKSKDRDFLSAVTKDTKGSPGPTTYNVGLNLLMKKNVAIYKKERYS